MKRLFSVSLLLFMIFFACALSEETEIRETYEIQDEAGGVIDRGTAFYRMRGLISELNVAYLDTDTPYMTKGVKTTFTIHASGGDGRYSYSFNLYRRSGTSGLFYYKASRAKSTSNTFTYTPTDSTGQFLLLVRIIDSAGSYIEWQSQVFESGSTAACKKANALAEECKEAADTDYARALWLHDWLIYNADYDRQYEYFYPEGVLLYGRGVCQSYALAYDMLLKLVGIDSVYLTGYAGGDAHGWNLVNINGSWCHVDCTWDDPAQGMENHNYFCVTDEVMSRDHFWKHETPILPACEDDQYMYAVRSGACNCTSNDDVIAILNESLLIRRHYTEIWYTGTLASFDFHAAVKAWDTQAVLPEGFLGYKYSAGLICLKIEFDFGDGYRDLSIPETITLEAPKEEMNTGENMKLLVLSSPSGADKSNLTWTSSNESAITVKNGTLTAVGPGLSVITAKHEGGAKASVTLYVNSGGVFTLPAFIKEIEEGSFADCVMLETVVLHQGTTSIGKNAFENCTLLKSVTIPNTVSYIAPDAFSGCKRVTIYCENGSYAHAFARSAGIDCELMSKEP